jgi:hypothetical protein
MDKEFLDYKKQMWETNKKVFCEKDLALDPFKIYEIYKNKKIPEYLPVKTNISAMNCREEITKISSFPLLAWNWIKLLAEYIGNKKCLEICCGLGTLSWALKELNINIIATDNFSSHFNFAKKNLWTNIEQIDCIEAIKKYGKSADYIILSWPTYSDNLAYNCLLKMRKINRNCKMIYIGEQKCGCCADDNFFDTGNFDYKELENIKNIFPCCEFIHDGIAIVT